MAPDHCTQSGAALLAARIKAFWSKRGVEIQVRIEEHMGRDDKHLAPVFVVRSKFPMMAFKQIR